MNILGTTFAALLNSLWQSTAIALLVWAALRFLPRLNVKINAATRCAVWWAVLAAVVSLPIAPQQTNAPGRVVEAPLPPPESASIPVQALPAPVALAAAETTPAPSRAGGPLPITPGAGLLAIFAIWSALSLFRITQIIRSYRYLSGIKQRSRGVSPEQLLNFNYWLLACRVDRTARLLVSSEIVSPMAVGFRRPAVIVPETLLHEFTGEELDHVLLHELAHIARYDDWTNLFARLIGAILPIHPVAVWLVKKIEQEREVACDDWVVAMTGEARPYAASLARLFELCSVRRRQLLATGMAGRASHLAERIEALLRSGRDFAPRVSLVRVALGAAVLLGLVLAGARAPHWVAFAQEPVIAPLPPAPPVAPVIPAAPVAPAPPIPEVAPQPPRALQQPVAESDRSLQDDIDARQREAQAVSEHLERLRRQIQERGRTYTPAHPDSPRIEEQIRAAEDQLRAREAEMREREQQLVAEQAPQSRIDRGPNGSFLGALVAAGYGGISVDEIIELHSHGITPAFLRALGQAGADKVSTKELIALADSGVRPDLFRALRAAFPKATVREFIEAAQTGLNAEDLRRAKEFSPSLTLEQVVRLKKAGVI